MIEPLKNLVKKGLLKLDSESGQLRKLPYSSGILSLNELDFPDFMCIGAQKAGTTWLWENLKFHPGIFLPENRYIHYFDRNYNSSFKKYCANFSNGRGLIKGEVIPGYGLIEQKRIQFIKKVNPNLKLIFIIRNPIDRAWSHALMHYTKFKGMAYEDITDDDFIKHFNSELSLLKGDYNTILSNWLTTYPKDSFLICFNEEIAQQPEELLNRIFRHIGVDEIKDFSNFHINTKINKGKSKVIPPHLETVLKKMYQKKIETLTKEYGSYALNW